MKTRTGYLIKRNKIYHACWTVNGKKVMKSTRKTDKKDAKAKLDELMSAFHLVDDVKTLEHIAGEIQGRKTEIARINDERNPALTITDAWQSFVASPNRPDSGPETLQQYSFQFNRFARWMKETHPTTTAMRDVTKEIAQEYASHLQGKGVAAGTFTKHVRLLHLVFATVADKARLTANPWIKDNITRRKAPPQSRRELTFAELRTVCESAKGELRPLLALGIYTGLRLGDCCTLRWCEVDLTLGFIRRLPNKTARKGASVKIPLHTTLRAILKEIHKAKRGEYVVPELAALYTSRKRYLITDRIQGHFKTCGITTQKPGTGEGTDHRAVVDVGFHSFRHSFVSICRAANVPLSVVESLVGHSNPAMTRHYTHTSEEAALAAMSSLPSVLGHKAPKALAGTTPPRMVAADAIRAIAERLTEENANEIKADLLAMVS